VTNHNPRDALQGAEHGEHRPTLPVESTGKQLEQLARYLGPIFQAMIGIGLPIRLPRTEKDMFGLNG